MFLDRSRKLFRGGCATFVADRLERGYSHRAPLSRGWFSMAGIYFCARRGKQHLLHIPDWLYWIGTLLA
jgi:hypothetical protein